MRHKANGRRERAQVVRARRQVLKRAKRLGVITNSEAKSVLQTDQAYYHLNKLREAGYLKRKGYNNWVPTKRRGRIPLEI